MNTAQKYVLNISWSDDNDPKMDLLPGGFLGSQISGIVGIYSMF